MSTALILVDCQVDHIAVGGEHPIKRLKQWYAEVDLVIASIRYAADTCKKGTKGARLNPYVAKLADVVVTKQGAGVSAFEGGSLRPIEPTERILKSHVPLDQPIDRVVVGGYFLEWTVAQTAFDANALGLDTSIDLAITASESGEDWAKDFASIDFGNPTIFKRLEQAGVRLISSRPATLDA